MTDHPVIEVRGVWKIFGNRAEESLEAVNREGIGKPEVLERFGCVVGVQDAEVWVAFSKSLYQRNPRVANFFKNMTLDPATVNGWILQVGKEKLDPQDVAEEWVENNKAIVDKWLAES